MKKIPMNKVTGETLRKLALPADTHHLFCDKCLAMYRGNSYVDNNILLMVHPDSRGAAMEGMMPLLKAMAAFLDHFTGTQTTFTIAKGTNNPSGFYRQPTVRDIFSNGGGLTSPKHFVDLSIQDLALDKTNVMTESISNSYAMTGAPNSIMFKSGILLGSSPSVPGMTTAYALTFMVHEFTAHRFDNDFTYWLNDTKSSPSLSKDRVARAGHFDKTGHCTVGNKCLNGFTAIGASNALHALPFFQKWYDDHKDDPITMYGSPAPRRRLGSPAPPPVAPPVAPPPRPAPAAYLAVKPFIPEPADIEPVVEV